MLDSLKDIKNLLQTVKKNQAIMVPNAGSGLLLFPQNRAL